MAKKNRTQNHLSTTKTMSICYWYCITYSSIFGNYCLVFFCACLWVVWANWSFCFWFNWWFSYVNMIYYVLCTIANRSDGMILFKRNIINYAPKGSNVHKCQAYTALMINIWTRLKLFGLVIIQFYLLPTLIQSKLSLTPARINSISGISFWLRCSTFRDIRIQ